MAALDAGQEASGPETLLVQQPLGSASRRAAAPPGARLSDETNAVARGGQKSALGRRIDVNGTTGALFTGSLQRR